MQQRRRASWDWTDIIPEHCNCTSLLEKLSMRPEVAVLVGVMTFLAIVLLALNVWDAFRGDVHAFAASHYDEKDDALEGHDAGDSNEELDINSLSSEIIELDDDNDTFTIQCLPHGAQEREYTQSTIE
ncbi:hypothetical protein BU16DRAFT_536176 [Lophium mytilinum]|uniref:Uncharacterized protein n=1 Tax=Lophium mytilinum TaxID=390894 RepID=A0A6A6R825_9PEZI|nr:hypothetical protein BU16DRAFT_536176 [Lophium mytilinum]